MSKESMLVTPSGDKCSVSRSSATGEDLHILTTYNCNNDCFFCVSGGPEKAKKKKTPSLDEIKRMVDQANLKSDSKVVLDGGEATVHPDFIEILKYIYQKNPGTISLLSNGVNFSNFDFAKQAVRMLDSVDISVYAHKEKLYNYMTRSNNFKRLVTGVKNVFKLRDSFGMNIDIDLKILVCKPVWDKIHDLTRFIIQQFPRPSQLQFVGMSVMAKGLENSDKSASKISRSSEYIKRGIEMAERQNYKVLLKAIPPCILGEESYFKYYKEFPGYADPKHGLFQLVNGPQCEYCRFKDRCTGVRKGYANYFGFNELEPFY